MTFMVLFGIAVAGVMLYQRRPTSRTDWLASVAQVTGGSVREEAAVYVPVVEVRYQFGGTAYVAAVACGRYLSRRSALARLRQECGRAIRPILVDMNDPCHIAAGARG